MHRQCTHKKYDHDRVSKEIAELSRSYAKLSAKFITKFNEVIENLGADVPYDALNVADCMRLLRNTIVTGFRFRVYLFYVNLRFVSYYGCTGVCSNC